MLIKEMCKLAMQRSSLRLVLTYSGNDKFALGLSDGTTSPIVVNGSANELEAQLLKQMQTYQDKAETEDTKRKEKEVKERRQAIQPTAILALSCSYADIENACDELSLQIGKDIDVFTFEIPETLARPPRNNFRYMVPDLRKIGRETIDLCLEQLRNPSEDDTIKLVDMSMAQYQV